MKKKIRKRLSNLSKIISSGEKYDKYDRINIKISEKVIPQAIDLCDFQSLTETIREDLFGIMGRNPQIMGDILGLVGDIGKAWKTCEGKK